MTPFPFLRDMVRILSFIPSQSTDAVVINYFRALAGATAAAAVAEGADKPQSSPTWESVQAPVRKVAHWAKATDEVIADFNAFMDTIGREMLAGLIDQENEQLLNGSGVAPNLTGLLTTTGILTRARGSDSNFDALLKAVTDLRTGAAFTEPDTVIINPANMQTIRLAKDGQGQYLLGNPLSSDPVSLNGARFAVTNRIAAGTALVGNLKEAARAYIRQVPTLQVNPQGGEAEWKANLTLLREE